MESRAVSAGDEVLHVAARLAGVCFSRLSARVVLVRWRDDGTLAAPVPALAEELRVTRRYKPPAWPERKKGREVVFCPVCRTKVFSPCRACEIRAGMEAAT